VEPISKTLPTGMPLIDEIEVVVRTVLRQERAQESELDRDQLDQLVEALMGTNREAKKEAVRRVRYELSTVDVVILCSQLVSMSKNHNAAHMALVVLGNKAKHCDD